MGGMLWRDVTKTITQISRPKKEKKKVPNGDVEGEFHDKRRIAAKGRMYFWGGSKVVSNPMAMAGFLEKAKPEPAAKEWAEPAEGSPYSGRSQGGAARARGSGGGFLASFWGFGGPPAPSPSPGNRPRKLRWGKCRLLLTTKT
jgi:hypothetical protein